VAGPAVGVERIVHRELQRHVLDVVPADLAGDVPGLGIGAAHDLAEGAKSRIGQPVLVEKRVE